MQKAPSQEEAYEVEQLPFPDITITDGIPQLPSTPITTSQPNTGPIYTTGTLKAILDTTKTSGTTQPFATNAYRSNTTALRMPVVIKGSGKQSTGMLPPQPKGRRLMLHVTVTALLLFIMAGSLMAVAAVGDVGAHTGTANSSPSTNGMYTSSGDNSALLAQQAATATAVTQDGYEPPQQTSKANNAPAPTYPGVNPGPALGGSGNHFFQGQCTYWAAYRFHQLTNVWVPWLGDAWQWSGQATASGWHVSGKPSVGAIIVLQPGVQGAGGYGHVAIVERINSDGSVYASNYNWYAGGGGFGILSYWTFSPGSGVSFVTL
ncbi:CHAP domain-containing protein [Ktedonobacter robiniae]|uniref:CHAP domain-containing protein n=1 Tax=Ktedonobacter robiniae TaxID=2778365 RepID=UPI001915C695|nr:CHAP domain-containing protein [Ktedonobacter robiniae]